MSTANCFGSQGVQPVAYQAVWQILGATGQNGTDTLLNRRTQTGKLAYPTSAVNFAVPNGFVQVSWAMSGSSLQAGMWQAQIINPVNGVVVDGSTSQGFASAANEPMTSSFSTVIQSTSKYSEFQLVVSNIAPIAPGAGSPGFLFVRQVA